MNDMRNLSWHGLAGVILAAAVGLGWAVSMIITALQDGPVTDAGAQILNTIGGGLVGAVATWIGLSGGRKPGDPDLNQPTKRTTTEEVHSTSLDTPARRGDDDREEDQ